MDGLRHVCIASYDKIGDAFAARRDKLRPETGITELQVLFFDLRQQRFRAPRKISDGQAIFFVIVFLFHIRRSRADEYGSPECLGEMHAETESIRVRQWINKIVDEG